MLLISKEDFMKELGTSEEEQKDLVPLTFDAFRNLQVGDVVFFVDDWDYLIKVPYYVDFAKWLPSPAGVFTNKGKAFFYKQISFIRGDEKRYADSAGSNYRNLYVRSSLFEELLKRKKQMKTKFNQKRGLKIENKAYLINNIDDYGKLIAYCIYKDISVWRTYYDDTRKGNVCYEIDWGNKKCCYGSLDFFREEGYEIVIPEFEIDKYGKVQLLN